MTHGLNRTTCRYISPPTDPSHLYVHGYAVAGMEKVNFSGGEPFITNKGRYVGELVRYCKQDLGLPSVSIVSNGSLITEEWFQEYGTYGRAGAE